MYNITVCAVPTVIQNWLVDTTKGLAPLVLVHYPFSAVNDFACIVSDHVQNT